MIRKKYFYLISVVIIVGVTLYGVSLYRPHDQQLETQNIDQLSNLVIETDPLVDEALGRYPNNLSVEVSRSENGGSIDILQTTVVDNMQNAEDFYLAALDKGGYVINNTLNDTNSYGKVISAHKEGQSVQIQFLGSYYEENHYPEVYIHLKVDS